MVKQRQADPFPEPSDDEMNKSNDTGQISCLHSKCVKNNVISKKLAQIKLVCSYCLNESKETQTDLENKTEEANILYVCLSCVALVCGKNKKNHVLNHYKISRSDSHCMYMDTKEFKIWCFECDHTLTHDCTAKEGRLKEAKNVLERCIQKQKSAALNKPPTPPKHIIKSVTQMESNKLPKVYGLTNLGNTCFFNSVLQCLAQTPFLVKVLDDLQLPEQKFVLEGGKIKGSNNEDIILSAIKGTLKDLNGISTVLRNTLFEMQRSERLNNVYRPIELYNELKRKSGHCTDGDQHDSHELLRHLLEAVRTEDVKRYQRIILEEFDVTTKAKEKEILKSNDEKKTIIRFYGNQASAKLLGPERVFRGELISTLECLECHHKSSKTERFLDLSLPIPVETFPLFQNRMKNNSFENKMDSMGNNVSNFSKAQSKKEQRANKKNRLNKLGNGETKNEILEPNKAVGKKGSEGSDADIEDNAELEKNDEKHLPSFPDCGLSGSQTFNCNLNSPELNTKNDSNFQSDIDLTNNAGLSQSSSPTDVSMADLTQENDNTDKLDKTNTEDFNNGILSKANNQNSIINKDDFEMNVDKESLITSDFNRVNNDNIEINFNNEFNEDFIPRSTRPLSDPLEETGTNITDSTFYNVSNNITDEIENKNDNREASFYKEEFSMAVVPYQPLIPYNSLSSNDIEMSNNSENLSINHEISSIEDNFTSNNLNMDFQNSTQTFSRYLVNEKECSIESCLNQFTDVELMDGNNAVACKNCTDTEKARNGSQKDICTKSTIQYLISCVPPVLILHLKRFQLQRFGFRKVSKHVKFPLLLDLSPVCKDRTKPKMYSLYGIVEHSGGLNSGHYVAYVKARAPLKENDPRWSFLPSKDGFENDSSNKSDAISSQNVDTEIRESYNSSTDNIEAPPGKWYYVSDSRVSEIDEKSVLQREAYLLFYERIL